MFRVYISHHMHIVGPVFLGNDIYVRVPVVVYCTIFIGEHIFVRDCGSSQKMLMGQVRALAWQQEVSTFSV